MARDLNISSNVIFNGKAAWEEMPFYYHCANVFATASTTETQGLTVIEAMAASVVPLCIKDESFLGTVTHELNGLIFNDEDEFVNQVLTLYKDNALLQKYNNQARIQAEHCSSTSYAERVLEVYKRAILDKKAEDRFGLISKISKKIKGE